MTPAVYTSSLGNPTGLLDITSVIVIQNQVNKFDRRFSHISIDADSHKFLPLYIRLKFELL